MKNKYVTIFIDDKPLQAMEGQTILEAALENEIIIPNLCHAKKVSHTAACRLCVVNIEGRRGAVPSCTTNVEEGMKITAFNEDLEKVRKMTLDLLLSNHRDDCISCVQDGDCELQDLAFRYSLGRDERRLPAIWEELTKVSDDSSHVLSYDATKCIQCQRCLKACKEIQGKGVISFVNRGIFTSVSTGNDEWKDSKCDGCGECIQICPTGALVPKPIYGGQKRVRAKDVEEEVVTTCVYCGVGCQLKVSVGKSHGVTPAGCEGGKHILKVEGAEGIPNHGSTCVKGRFGLDFLERDDRLKKPLVRKDGKLVEVEWNEAISYTSKRLAEIKEKHGGDSIGGLASAKVTNEENYVFQKFMRSVVGTNNVDHCARL